MVDLVAGRIAMMFDAVPSLLPFITAGKLRVLAAASPERHRLLPDVPSFAELGYPKMDIALWYGIAAPGGTPAPIVQRLNAELIKILDLPDNAQKQRTEAETQRIRPDLHRVAGRTVRIDQLESQLGQLVTPLASSLLALQGCGVLTAAKIIGEVGNISRFRSEAAFARYNGSAPIPVWSGNNDHHRLNPGGNRQLNAALHRIAITQLRREGLGRAYLEHRLHEGDTRKEAIRALKRRLSNEVYQRLLSDERTQMASADRPHVEAA